MDALKEDRNEIEMDKMEIKVEPYHFLDDWEIKKEDAALVRNASPNTDLRENSHTKMCSSIKQEREDNLHVYDGIVCEANEYSNGGSEDSKRDEATTLGQDSKETHEFTVRKEIESCKKVSHPNSKYLDTTNLCIHGDHNEHLKQFNLASRNNRLVLRNYLLNESANSNSLNPITGIGSNLHQLSSQFSCKLCKKPFKRKHDMERHVICHSEIKPYSCNICGKSFKEKRGLKGHLVIHSDAKPFTCEICQRSFKVKGALRSHLLFHSDSKPFECELCEKSFKRRDILQEHMLSHSDIKPLVCEVCNKSWKRNSDLKRHMVSHSKERPFVCEICAKCFKDKRILKKHKLHHCKLR